MPGVASYRNVHIFGGSTNRSLIHRIATGIGGKVRDLSAVLILPWTTGLKTMNPRELPFTKQFSINGREYSAKAFTDNFGPPRVILLRSELFEEPLFDGSKSPEDRFLGAYFFCKTAVELIKNFSMPFPVVNCHGTETGLLPYLMKADPELSKEKAFYTIHHNEMRTSVDPEETTFSLDHAVFPERFFASVPSLAKVPGVGADLFYEGKISLVKAGVYFSDIAMVLHKKFIEDLFAKDPTETNFFRRMFLRGKLTFLLGDEDMGLDQARKAKKIIDINAEAAGIVGPYAYSQSMPAKHYSGTNSEILIHTSQAFAGREEEAKEALAISFGPKMKERVRVYPSFAGGPRGSGSAILYMLSKLEELYEGGAAVEKPVVHLNVGGESISMGSKPVTSYEVAARQAGMIFPQLPNGKNNWVPVLGNTTLTIPESRLMSGSSLIRYRKAGIFLFGFPIDVGKRTESEMNVISKQWGAVFADAETGNIFSIRERPTVDEIKEGARIGGDRAYLNLSNYAVRADVAKEMVDMYMRRMVDQMSKTIIYKAYSLHFVKHMIEPMILASRAMTELVDTRSIWEKRFETEGVDFLQKPFFLSDWMALYDYAHHIVKTFGPVAVAYGTGKFQDLRSKAGREKLGRILDAKSDTPDSAVLKRFFAIPVPSGQKDAPGEPYAPEREDITIGGGARVAPVDEGLVLPDVMIAGGSGPVPDSIALFRQMAGSMIGLSHPAAVKLLETTIKNRADQISAFDEKAMRDGVLKMKRYLFLQVFEWAETPMGKEFLRTLPEDIAADLPLEGIEGLFKAMRTLAQGVFSDKKPHASYYACDPFQDTFLVTAEGAPQAADGSYEIRSAVDLETIITSGQRKEIVENWILPAGRYIFSFHRMHMPDLDLDKF
jgi:hypothetical protein